MDSNTINIAQLVSGDVCIEQQSDDISKIVLSDNVEVDKQQIDDFTSESDDDKIVLSDHHNNDNDDVDKQIDDLTSESDDDNDVNFPLKMYEDGFKNFVESSITKEELRKIVCGRVIIEKTFGQKKYSWSLYSNPHVFNGEIGLIFQQDQSGQFLRLGFIEYSAELKIWLTKNYLNGKITIPGFDNILKDFTS